MARVSSRVGVVGFVCLVASISTVAWAAEGEAARSPAGIIVFASDFEKGASKQWSRATTRPTPGGERVILGEFVNDAVTLSLDELPAHGRVRVSFDLIIAESWDGSYEAYGPDIVDVTVGGGPNLLHTTFSNCPFFKDIQSQSFPGKFPFDKNEPMTGAQETNSLGYTHPFGLNNQPTTPCDAVYHIERSFAHSGKSLKVIFTGTNLETKPDNEVWGLDRVKVEVLPEGAATPLDDAAFAKAWADLSDDSAVTAAPALAAISEAGNGVVAKVRKELRLRNTMATAASRPADASNEIAKLIAQLDADDFNTREQATESLRKLGPAAEAQLRKALAASPSPEAKARLESLLTKPEEPNEAEKTIEPADRLAWRATQALELIGTEDAKKLLGDIAAQKEWKAAAAEAQAAQVRLAGRGEPPTPTPFHEQAAP